MIEPQIGMGATYTIGSDSYPYTVVGLRYFKTGPKKGEVRYVLIQADAIVPLGAHGCRFEPNTNSQVEECVRDKFGNWKVRSAFISFGIRDYYRDPSF